MWTNTDLGTTYSSLRTCSPQHQREWVSGRIPMSSKAQIVFSSTQPSSHQQITNASVTRSKAPFQLPVRPHHRRHSTQTLHSPNRRETLRLTSRPRQNPHDRRHARRTRQPRKLLFPTRRPPFSLEHQTLHTLERDPTGLHNRRQRMGRNEHRLLARDLRIRATRTRAQARVPRRRGSLGCRQG